MAPSAPTKTDVAFFSDAEELETPRGEQTPAELAEMFRGLVRADLAGARRGAVLECIERARPEERQRLVFALYDALQSDELARFIEASDEARRNAVAIAQRAAPADPSPAHNRAALAALAAFKDQAQYAYPLIIVPGYTPLDQARPAPGVHPIARRRLAQAMDDAKNKLAPFILVSGANVYPRGTPYYEAIEMKSALLAMGFPAERVFVEARARHSTTNLRNAGRFMLERGMARAIITTVGGGVGGTTLFDQDFYFSSPNLSTFYLRSERELGYRVGELRSAGPSHTEFTPSPSVVRVNYRDPLDP